MHIVDGEHAHGHTHAHTHAHTHGDGQTHTHEHTHAHSHEGADAHSHHHLHEEGHAHTHSHEHACTGCGGCGQEKPANEQEALLTYMLDHNRHHAAELLEIAKQVKAAGKEEAAQQIERAVENFEKGNLYLSVALSLVK